MKPEPSASCSCISRRQALMSCARINSLHTCVQSCTPAAKSNHKTARARTVCTRPVRAWL
eukprot:3328982-Rhodomonas_salina.2